MLVLGVDGCPAGWVAAAVDLSTGTWTACVHHDLAELVEAHPRARAIAVDIPIGLPGDGARRCDRLARARLGRRRSSVFTAPSRRLLDLIADAPGYREANARARVALGHGIGAQAFNIYAKIREADRLLTADLQTRVREVHPELSFAAMRGAPCPSSKHTALGAAERMEALRRECPWVRSGGSTALRPDEWALPPRGAAQNDLLDALAAAWTAARIVRGEAQSLPAEPELDPRGLRMEIVF